MTHRRRSLPIATALSALFACTAATDVADPATDQPLDSAFEELYRIGVMEGESWEMLGRVAGVGFDESGRLYIFDTTGGFLSSGLRVLVFDASGGFRHEFGESGEGPGEINRPSTYAVMRNGTVVIGDVGARGYHLFDAEGQFVRTVLNDNDVIQGNTRTTVSSGAIHPDPAGGAFFSSSSGIRVGRSEAPTSRPIARNSLEGDVLAIETIIEGWLPPRDGAGIQISGGPAELASMLSGFSMPATFEPPLLMGVLPDGNLVYSDSSAYALKVASAETGEVLGRIGRPLSPRPVTDAVKEEYQAQREERRRNAESAPTTGQPTVMFRTQSASPDAASGGQQMSFRIPDPPFYPEIPVLQQLVTTWDGRIWVMRAGDELIGDGPIDVLSADGDYIGTWPTGEIAMPDAFGPDGLAAFIELDDFDVASVVVRRLPAEVR